MLLGLFAALLIGLPVLAEYAATPLAAQLAGFYRAGALVFGGGHVVLPMLESTAVAGGMVSQPDFLAGYGAAQAMPGPLFSFAAFLGVAAQHRRRLDGLDQRFQHAGDDLPAGRLLLAGAMPFWDGLRRRPGVRNMLAGVNAAVVGVLLSALYDPYGRPPSVDRRTSGWPLLLFGLLVYARWSPVWVVMTAAAGGWALAGWPDPPGAVQARPRQRGARFCRKASMPSAASSSIMLRAMTSPA